MSTDAKDPADNQTSHDTPDNNIIDHDAIDAKLVNTSHDEALDPETNATSPPAQHNKAPVHKGVWFLGGLNLLFIVLLAAAGYWYWLQQQNQIAQPNPDIIALENAVSVMNTELVQLTSALSANQTLTNDHQSLLLEFSEVSAQLATNIDEIAQRVNLNELKSEGLAKRIAEVSGRRPADWLLAEADYLVKLAGKKLWLEGDVKSAIMLLKSADVRISDLADASLLPVRALLAKDIQTLQQVNQVSTESIALSVSALIAQADNLPLDTLKLPDVEAPEVTAELSNDVANWQANLKSSWNAIVDDFISVNKRTAEVTPFISKKEQWLAREQLKFALLNAQQAVMNHQTKLYQQALQQSLDIVIAHYALDNIGVEAYIDSIQHLILIDTSRELPKQLDAQQPLAEIIEQRIQTLFAGSQ